MNSRERIETIFSWGAPDRVGRYEQSVYSSVGSAILGRRAHTGGTAFHFEQAKALIKGGSAYDDLIERIYQDRAELGRKLKFDMIGVPWLHGGRPSAQLDDYEFLYGDLDGDTWSIWRYDPASETYGEVDSAARHDDEEDLGVVVEEAEAALGKEPDEEPLSYRILARLLADFGDDLAVLGFGGMGIPLTEPWLMATTSDTGLVEAYLDVQLEASIRGAKKQAEMGVKIIWGGGDFADNHGVIYGPAVFQELLLPRWAKLMEVCHELELWYVLRSDGNLWAVTDMLFDQADVDGYGEIDWNAGMDLVKLKEKYPRVTYWGAVPPPLIRNGSKQEVLNAAKHCIDAMRGDRRLILGSSNSILPGTPVENVLALTEAIDTWGVE